MSTAVPHKSKRIRRASGSLISAKNRESKFDVSTLPDRGKRRKSDFATSTIRRGNVLARDDTLADSAKTRTTTRVSGSSSMEMKFFFSVGKRDFSSNCPARLGDTAPEAPSQIATKQIRNSALDR